MPFAPMLTENSDEGLREIKYRRQEMKRMIAVSILTFLGLAMFISAGDSLAGEVVFCVDREDQSVVIADAKGLCGDGKEEYVISGTGVEQSEDLAPLVAVLPDNQHCDEGLTGTATRVGFDENDDGSLNDDEVMAIFGSCDTSGQ